MPLNMQEFQDGTSETPDTLGQLAEANKIIASLQKENAELRAHHCDQQRNGIYFFKYNNALYIYS